METKELMAQNVQDPAQAGEVLLQPPKRPKKKRSIKKIVLLSLAGIAVLALAGGLLFGFWAGAAYTFLGAVLNCTLMFFLARRLGKKQVERMLRSRLGERADRIFSFLEGRRGFLFLVLLRLIPAFPYNLINYAYGLSAMDYKTYILASAIGIIPGTCAFINIGDHMLDLSSPGFWTSLGLMALLLFVTAALGKLLFPNNAKIKINTNGEKNGTK